MHVLVTGFEPFGGQSLNPSQACLEELGALQCDGLRITARVLPVERQRAGQRLLSALGELRPDAVLMFGEAGGRAQVCIERVAINVDDYRIPDHAGDIPCDEPIEVDGPAAYLSTLPLRAMVGALHERGIPACISNTAGTYLCNHVFYRVLHALATRGEEVPAGFIHLPYLSAQVLDSADPGLPLDTQITAVRTLIDVCGDHRAGIPTPRLRTHPGVMA